MDRFEILTKSERKELVDLWDQVHERCRCCRYVHGLR